MRVTPPVDINQNKLISSSATEVHDPAEYSAGAVYGFGAIVKVAADFKIYESILVDENGQNTGHSPSTSNLWWRVLGPIETPYSSVTNYALGATCSYNRRCYESLAAGNLAHTPPLWPETQNTWWIDVGPTNRWAMFDLQRNTQTVWPSPLTVTFRPGERVNTIGVTGMRGNLLQVSATSVFGNGQVYPNANTASPTGIFDLNTRTVRDGYEYAFEPFSTITSNTIFDIPPYSDIVITLRLTSVAGNVKIGSLVAGNYIYLGAVQHPAKADSLNFSTITRDIYGNATLVPRAAYPMTSQTLRLPSNRVNKVMAAKRLLDAKPALWTGLDDPASDWFEMLQIMGIWKEFTFTAVRTRMCEITLSLEEI